MPSNNLHIAYDPRIPINSQAVEFYLRGVKGTDVIHWSINDQTVTDMGNTHIWPIEKGKHSLRADVIRDGVHIAQTPEISFWVK